MNLVAAIITAGGTGSRMGGERPKQFLPLAGKPVLIHTIGAFAACSAIGQIVIVVPAHHSADTTSLLLDYDLEKRCLVVPGGDNRQASVRNGLQEIQTAEYVVVHDGVRPLISPEALEECIRAAHRSGAAILATPVHDTLKEVEGSTITKTVDRSKLWRAQTPQVVRRDLLNKAFQVADTSGFCGTDESSLLENIGVFPEIVVGSETNIKITLPGDLQLAETFIARDKKTPISLMKIGHGYDVHQFATDRLLILAGEQIPYSHGLLGHSDADVLTHALCDALLGAAGLGDIGHHFPDSDSTYEGISSILLLEDVLHLLRKQALSLANADITVIAQAPKLAPYLEKMRANLALVCQVPVSHMNIKATTTEKLGFAGRGEGIACHAVVLLTENPKR